MRVKPGSTPACLKQVGSIFAKPKVFRVYRDILAASFTEIDMDP
jgi:hypothetical protein